jgi:DNA-binding transcriptional ArsR family regulator
MASLLWHTGTAYDFFISLLALHHAADFGLRPSWAAGVRQRLLSPQREFLELVYSFASLPLDWLSGLPEPRDVSPVLEQAARLAPVDRLRILTLPGDLADEPRQALEHIAARGSASHSDKETLTHSLKPKKGPYKPAEMNNLLTVWTDAERSAERMLAALHEYYLSFFSDEETRIRPVLQAGLRHAQELSARVSLPELVEELSRGVHFEDLQTARELALVPSYWLSPLVIPSSPAKGSMQIVFGCRPDDLSVAPGAETPSLLVNALKSLADPTRLRILRYCSGQPLTPTELSRRLRLRPPTVLHHLQALRLAELVTIRVSETGEKRYTCRAETLNTIFNSVKDFVNTQD